MDNRERITELAVKARQGSQDAFNELYRLTRDRAYFVALTITRNEQDALDILQDSFLKAWQSLDSLQKPEQFPAWLQRITGNTAKNYIKHHSPLLFTGSDDDTDDLFDLQVEKDSEYIPDAAMDTAETRQLIMKIVDGLPEDQRLCVLMYYYEDMGLAETADALGVPQSTVTSRLYRARKKISDGVEDLEHKGTKLYSAAPIPLLIWLLRKTAGETGKALPPVILGGSAAGAAVIGGTLAAKIIAGIAAVVIVGGGTVAGVVRSHRPEPQPAEAIAFSQYAVSEATMFRFPSLPESPSAIQPLTAQTAPKPVTRPAAANATAAQPTRENITSTTQTATRTTATTTSYVYTAPATKATTAATTTTTTTTTATTTETTTSGLSSPAGDSEYEANRIVLIAMCKTGNGSDLNPCFDLLFPEDSGEGPKIINDYEAGTLLQRAKALIGAHNVLTPAQEAAWVNYVNAYSALLWWVNNSCPADHNHGDGTSACFNAIFSPGLTFEETYTPLLVDSTTVSLTDLQSLTARVDAGLRRLDISRPYDDPTRL